MHPGAKSDLTDMVCCYIWLDSLDPLQQLLGRQPFQQATVTMKFKMASKMAAVFLNIHAYFQQLLLYFHS